MATDAKGAAKHARERYLEATDWKHLDDFLHTYLDMVVRRLEEYEMPHEEAQEVVAELCLIGPLHLTRKRTLLHKNGRLANMLGAFAFEGPLADKFRSASVTTNKKFIHFSLPSQIEVAGFDPRFSDGTAAINSLRTLAIPPESKGAIPPKHALREGVALSEKYSDAKVAIYRDFHDASTRYDLFLVDVVWLPELAAQGHIVALDDHMPNIELFIQGGLARLKTSIWPAAALDSVRGTDGFHYGFPYLLNFHGRLVPKRKENKPEEFKDQATEIRIKNKATKLGQANATTNWPSHLAVESDLNDLSRAALMLSSVQTASPSLTYELFAHMAFEDHVPIVLSEEDQDKTLLPTIEKVDFRSKNARDAIAALVARLVAHMRTPPGPNQQVIDQSVQRERLLDSSAYEEWGLLFSSELFNYLGSSPGMPAHPPLGSNFDLLAPFVSSKGQNCKLGCLGGYALAVSSTAYDVEAAVEVAATIFENSSKKNKGTCIVSEHTELLVNEPSHLARNFIARHSRPKLPCWSAVEAAIGAAIFELAEMLVKVDEEKKLALPEGNQAFKKELDLISAQLASPLYEHVLARLERQIVQVCSSYGLKVK